jgi:hypothetical protein
LKLKKKNVLIIAIAVLIVIIGIVALIVHKSNSTEGAKFKKEYEALNGVASSSGKFYQNIKIDKDNKVTYITLEEANEIMKSGTGIIYFGFADSALCRGIVPILLDAVDCSCLENLYYVDMTGLRDEYEVKDGVITETESGEVEYLTALEILSDYLNEYIVTDENGIEYVAESERMNVPLVVAVKDGEIKSTHEGSVDLDEGQTEYDALTAKQKSELNVIYTELIESITKEDTVCDEYC